VHQTCETQGLRCRFEVGSAVAIPRGPSEPHSGS
jgi:hypothetical protein